MQVVDVGHAMTTNHGVAVLPDVGIKKDRLTMNWNSWQVKALLIVASVAAFKLGMSFSTALVMVVAISLHEAGHLLAMKRCGMQGTTVTFIPFLGAVASSQTTYANQRQRAFVSAMGPLAGLVTTPILGLLCAWTSGNINWASETSFIVAFLNIANLLPVMPLDGGQIVYAALAQVVRPVKVALLVVSLAIACASAWALGSLQLFLVAFLGLVVLWGLGKGENKIPCMTRGQSIRWLCGYVALVLLGLIVALGTIIVPDLLKSGT